MFTNHNKGSLIISLVSCFSLRHFSPKHCPQCESPENILKLPAAPSSPRKFAHLGTSAIRDKWTSLVQLPFPPPLLLPTHFPFSIISPFPPRPPLSLHPQA